jgi:hypothetical protein
MFCLVLPHSYSKTLDNVNSTHEFDTFVMSQSHGSINPMADKHHKQMRVFCLLNWVIYFIYL